MSIDSPSLDTLARLLKSCTAQIWADDVPKGSAFFISEKYLITCDHVVDQLQAFDVITGSGQRRKGSIVDRRPRDELDLALIEVEPVLDSASILQPSVLLDDQLPIGQYLLAGYPREDGQPAGIEVMPVDAHPRDAGGNAQLLQIDAGRQIITWGLSGGPALNVDRGTVCAVVRWARDPQNNLGGHAIPISRAANEFEQVRDLMREPPLAVKTWRDTLGREHWQRLGQIWDMPRVIDLLVTGEHSHWCISVDSPNASGEDINGSNLGDELTEAMFHWALGRRLSADAEVKLLGQLLARALFPAGAASKLSLLNNADEILIRLRVAQDSDLIDIPWELAAVPHGVDRFLAADDQFRLVRVVDSDSLAGPPDSGKLEIRVLNVFGLPKFGPWDNSWNEKLDYLEAKMDDALADNSYRMKRLPYATPFDLKQTLQRDERYDVLHYIGLGKIDGETAKVCMVDDDNFGEAQDLKILLDSAEKFGIRLVILEFLGRVDGHEDPIGPKALGDRLPGSIEAIILTRFPLLPAQLQAFNKTFYGHLITGCSVEAAVQQARSALLHRVDDAAGFGCVTLVTGTHPNIRLVPQRLSLPKTPRTSQPRHGEASANFGGVR